MSTSPQHNSRSPGGQWSLVVTRGQFGPESDTHSPGLLEHPRCAPRAYRVQPLPSSGTDRPVYTIICPPICEAIVDL
ncbi:hypothetical protein RRG08_023620 [Elysia crispata]|uniref:Uncharacterized protein n=1 Tax=Elysia crispata TaxID=231223 RepID=A0AAE1CLL9_9GAST|nr:hypothetical protein RRG08_023620 [Elysia crispata]